MKIEAIDFLILESEPVEPEWTPYRTMREYPDSYQVRFGHKPFEGGVSFKSAAQMAL